MKRSLKVLAQYYSAKRELEHVRLATKQKYIEPHLCLWVPGPSREISGIVVV